MQGYSERRSLPRTLARYLIRFYYTDDVTHAESARTVNLTTQGACIESPELLPLGASVKFFVITPANQVIDIVGRVIHVKQDNQLPVQVGVRFTQLSNTNRQILARELKQTPSPN